MITTQALFFTPKYRSINQGQYYSLSLVLTSPNFNFFGWRATASGPSTPAPLFFLGACGIFGVSSIILLQRQNQQLLLIHKSDETCLNYFSSAHCTMYLYTFQYPHHNQTNKNEVSNRYDIQYDTCVHFFLTVLSFYRSFSKILTL